MEVKLEVKLDKCFIAAQCIVPFNSLFNSPFNSLLNSLFKPFYFSLKYKNLKASN